MLITAGSAYSGSAPCRLWWNNLPACPRDKTTLKLPPHPVTIAANNIASNTPDTSAPSQALHRVKSNHSPRTEIANANGVMTTMPHLDQVQMPVSQLGCSHAINPMIAQGTTDNPNPTEPLIESLVFLIERLHTRVRSIVHNQPAKWKRTSLHSPSARVVGG